MQLNTVIFQVFNKYLKFTIPVLVFAIALFFNSNAYAASKIPKVRLSVKPLDLSRAPSTEELMAAGQLGGQLYPTHEIKEKAKGKGIRLSFGHAIQEWNKHNYKNAVKLFEKHISDYPDSPWVAESILHMGCDSRYNGRYTEAETHFQQIMDDNKGKSHEGSQRMLNKARLRMGVLRFLQNNSAEAKEIFAILKEESPSWRDRTYASHWIQRLSRYDAQGLAMLKCGTQALAVLLEQENKKVEAMEVAQLLPSTDNGHSMVELINIAAGYGHELVGVLLTAADLNQIPLPAIMQIIGKQEDNKGHYWVLDKVNDSSIELYDPQSKRRFTQNADEFSREWSGKALVTASKTDITSTMILSAEEMRGSFGACCGVPAPEEDLGDPDDEPDCPNAKGSPIWKVNPINMNLYVTDIPLWYDPPYGPPVRIQLSYNSQSTIANNEPFGNKWMFNYGTYLVTDTGDNITIFMPDGRRDVYVPDGQGGYTKPFGVFNTLTKIAKDHFELEFLDGTVYVYDKPKNNVDQSFLVEIRDAHYSNNQNLKLTFGYNSHAELNVIYDALGRPTTITYYPDGTIDHIEDPFGRTATFTYDADRNLRGIEDMGGYGSTLTYDTDIYVTSIENSKGMWEFYIEPSDGIPNSDNRYPSFGSIMWEDYRITITNPLGEKEEYHYNGFDAYSWYVSPRDYVPYKNTSVNNYRSAKKTKYSLSDNAENKGEISRISYPEGDYISFTYDPATGKLQTKSDNSGPIGSYTYNGNGRLETVTDAKGNVTTYVYYPNNIDVQQITYDPVSTPEDDGIVLKSFTYKAGTHDVETVTDAESNITEYTYNTLGQLTSVIQAKNTALEMTTGFLYHESNHELVTITRGGSILTSIIRDPVVPGRVGTNTGPTGVALDYNYNNLDLVTKTTYPDTRFIDTDPSPCCPRIIDSITDRAGLTTDYTYDELNRLTRTRGPKGNITYTYDANGNLTELRDADNKPVTFEYDLDNRLVKKIYADDKFESYTYYPSGLIDTITNARLIEKKHTYDANNNLETITYSDSTPTVTYTYDDYNRIDTRTDGTGVYDYGYYTDGKLHTIDGSWPSDTVTFQYNERGQLKEISTEGTTAVSYLYDSLGRLERVQSGLNSHTYGYTGVNPQIQSLTRPSGSITGYQYNDPLKRLTDVINKDSSLQVINSYAYGSYNDLDLRSGETVTNGVAISSFTENTTSYYPNNLNQLLNTISPAGTFLYDDDGNMEQGYTPEGYVLAMTYDAENRLVSAEYTDNTGVVHRTEYAYSGDHMLAQVIKKENGAVISDKRFVRAGFLPVQERDENNQITREYTWGLNQGGGIGGLLNLRQGGQDYSYLYDGKGNVSALIDSAQNVVAKYTYDAFGVLKEKTATIDQPFMFSTKQYDIQTGLSYYGYRFYSPAIGKWITRDPIGEEGGINLYGFVGNDPINKIDPLGLQIWPGDYGYGSPAAVEANNYLQNLQVKTFELYMVAAGCMVKCAAKTAIKEVVYFCKPKSLLTKAATMITASMAYNECLQKCGDDYYKDK